MMPHQSHIKTVLSFKSFLLRCLKYKFYCDYRENTKLLHVNPSYGIWSHIPVYTDSYWEVGNGNTFHISMVQYVPWHVPWYRVVAFCTMIQLVFQTLAETNLASPQKPIFTDLMGKTSPHCQNGL